MSGIKHSPLPFTLRDIHWIEDADGEFITAEASPRDSEFIVLACNSFRDLLNCVKKLEPSNPIIEEVESKIAAANGRVKEYESWTTG